MKLENVLDKIRVNGEDNVGPNRPSSAGYYCGTSFWRCLNAYDLKNLEDELENVLNQLSHFQRHHVSADGDLDCSGFIFRLSANLRKHLRDPMDAYDLSRICPLYPRDLDDDDLSPNRPSSPAYCPISPSYSSPSRRHPTRHWKAWEHGLRQLKSHVVEQRRIREDRRDKGSKQFRRVKIHREERARQQLEIHRGKFVTCTKASRGRLKICAKEARVRQFVVNEATAGFSIRHLPEMLGLCTYRSASPIPATHTNLSREMERLSINNSMAATASPMPGTDVILYGEMERLALNNSMASAAASPMPGTDVTLSGEMERLALNNSMAATASSNLQRQGHI